MHPETVGPPWEVRHVHEWLWSQALRRVRGVAALLLGLALVYNWFGLQDDLAGVLRHRYEMQVRHLQLRLSCVSDTVARSAPLAAPPGRPAVDLLSADNCARP